MLGLLIVWLEFLHITCVHCFGVLSCKGSTPLYQRYYKNIVSCHVCPSSYQLLFSSFVKNSLNPISCEPWFVCNGLDIVMKGHTNNKQWIECNLWDCNSRCLSIIVTSISTLSIPLLIRSPCLNFHLFYHQNLPDMQLKLQVTRYM